MHSIIAVKDVRARLSRVEGEIVRLTAQRDLLRDLLPPEPDDAEPKLGITAGVRWALGERPGQTVREVAEMLDGEVSTTGRSLMSSTRTILLRLMERGEVDRDEGGRYALVHG